jgi:hypothetical protein
MRGFWPVRDSIVRKQKRREISSVFFIEKTVDHIICYMIN